MAKEQEEKKKKKEKMRGGGEVNIIRKQKAKTKTN